MFKIIKESEVVRMQALTADIPTLPTVGIGDGSTCAILDGDQDLYKFHNGAWIKQ